MRESILYSSIKALFVALFSMMGISLGLIPFIIILSSATSTNTDEIENLYTVEILPNAEGVRKTASKDAPVILQMNIKGIIGMDDLNMHSIRQILVESREGTLKDNRVKGILLHIETPGGTVIDSDGIYRALKAYKQQYKVPVYAYVDGLCASGGMYVASAADKVYASDVSLVGSVGVLAGTPFFNVTQLMEKIGIQALTLSAGKGKDDLNPFRVWKGGEEDTLQGILDYYYKHFVNLVTINRPSVDKTKLVDEYGAQVFPAEKAQEIGLIDGISNSMGETLAKLAHEAGIADEQYQVVQMDKRNWLSSLLAEAKSPLFTGKVKHEISIPHELPQSLHNQLLYLYWPEGM
jgi:signal peptide peptidase SppA